MPSFSRTSSNNLDSLNCMLTRVTHIGRTVLSTTAVQQFALLPTNSAPRPTREPSTQAFAPSTVLASLVGNGPRVASDSRALPELPGRYHDGLLLREPFLSLAPKTQLPLQPKAATKRTRKMETKPTACPAKTTAFLTATAALMSRCKARLASRPHHRHPLLWPLHHNISQSNFLLHFFSLSCFCFLVFASHDAKGFSHLIPHHVSNLEKKIGLEVICILLHRLRGRKLGQHDNIVSFLQGDNKLSIGVGGRD